MKFIETHIFSTGIDTPAFVNISLNTDSSSQDQAERDAANTVCRLIVTNEGVSLRRNGEVVNDDLLSITLDEIPQEVRERLSIAGSPLSPDDPSLGEKAIQGFEDGSLVIDDDELVNSTFESSKLSCSTFRGLLSKSEHIGYGVVRAS